MPRILHQLNVAGGIPPAGTLEGCFTGFSAAAKADLAALAVGAGMFVRPAVTKKLSVLCCGPNAGPAKTEKARQQGVIILKEDEFRLLIETGEVSDDA